jgi:hypothetical protein
LQFYIHLLRHHLLRRFRRLLRLLQLQDTQDKL